MGGAVAQLFAARYPERVRRLVIEESAPPPVDPPTEQRPEPPAAASHPVDHDWQVVGPIVRGFRTPDPAWCGSTSATAPTLVVAGGPSSSISQDRIHALAETLGAELVRIDVGHRVPRQAPDRFAEVVGEFLN